jgi:hypothetical protein
MYNNVTSSWVVADAQVQETQVTVTAWLSRGGYPTSLTYAVHIDMYHRVL